MSRVLVALIACIVLVAATAPPQGQASALKPGMLLYAMPGLPDSNFSKTVVLLLQHDSNGSLGVVLNRPTKLGVDEALDLKAGTSGIDLDVFWGGPVQPEAVLSLVRSRLPDSKARTIVRDVYLTQDLEEVKGVLGGRDGRLRARIFTGYAGWARGQLAAEVRGRSWVLEPADAATVFSSEPSRMWEKVHDILGRMSARELPRHADVRRSKLIALATAVRPEQVECAIRGRRKTAVVPSRREEFRGISIRARRRA
jgi:putative transcriptional regulator